MLKILIAEDDRELRQLFGHVLNRHGYTVVGVSNGQEALDAMDTDFYDMIISDIMMPVMDGYELVHQLRDVGNTTPILMITAKDAFFNLCCRLCSAYERKAFIDGLQYGAHLIQEIIH